MEPKKVKKCVFCKTILNDGSKSKANEHIFARKLLEDYDLLKTLSDHSFWHSLDESGVFSGGLATIEDSKRKPVFDKLKSGFVCGGCNNGWMSDLECTVRYNLYSLIDGKKSFCDISEKDKLDLASWVFKTVIVFFSAVPNPQMKIPSWHIDKYYSSRAVPDGVFIFGGIKSELKDAESNNFINWAFSPIWFVETEESDSQLELTEAVTSAYKFYINVGEVSFVCAYFPQNKGNVCCEAWNNNLLTNNKDKLIVWDKDSRHYFKNQLGMGILASIGAIYKDKQSKSPLLLK